MSDKEINLSRRRLLKTAGIATTVGIGGFYLAQNHRINDQIAERAKATAEILRKFPGLGYGGRPVALKSLIGGQTILAAESDEPGYWKGAPAIEYDEVGDRLLTYVRHRDPVNRGNRVSIYELDQESLEATELISLTQTDLNARSIEGGELLSMDGEFRWIISYQHPETGDWRIHIRRSPSIDGLRDGGHDIDIISDYYHNKDPAIVNGECYVISNSKNWLHSGIERVDIDTSQPVAEEINLTGIDNARITGGGVISDEIFADIWPNFPGMDISNFLWTTDERGACGAIGWDTVNINSREHFVSADRSSVTYINAELAGGTVYLLWQEKKPDGSNDLVGTHITLDEYEQLFVNNIYAAK